MSENITQKKTSTLDKQFQQMESQLTPEQEKAMRDKFMASINRDDGR